MSILQLKQLTKTIEDPLNWKALESLIENYMNEEFRFLYVNYTIIYSKAPQYIQIDETENSNSYKNDNLNVVQVALRCRTIHSI